MLLWATDTHFDFVKGKRPSFMFGQLIRDENPDATGLIVTGDITTGSAAGISIENLAKGFERPVYFVLGNHDYYERSWEVVDKVTAQTVEEVDNLHWLDQGFHMIADGVALCGGGGWYDAYYGNSMTEIELMDFVVIRELAHNPRGLILEKCRARAQMQANIMAGQIREAIKVADTIVVATHVSPYQESSWHEGEPSNRDWVPWFSSASTGMMLQELAKQNKDKKFVVLCGHSHSPGIYQHRDNIVVYTGKAVYRFPDLCGWIDLDKRMIKTYDSNRKLVEVKLEPEPFDDDELDASEHLERGHQP